MSYVLYGGLFDPPHSGHLSIALQAYRLIKPEIFIWVPSGNPHHRPPGHIDVQQRYDMLKWWVSRKKKQLNLNFDISHIEFEPGHDGYSLTSIMHFMSMYPGKKQYFLIGSDEAANLKNWHKWKIVAEKTNFIIADRSGRHKIPDEIAETAIRLENDVVRVSSTWIREHMHEHDAVCEYMDPDLLRYIHDNGLYK